MIFRVKKSKNQGMPAGLRPPPAASAGTTGSSPLSLICWAALLLALSSCFPTLLLATALNHNGCPSFRPARHPLTSSATGSASGWAVASLPSGAGGGGALPVRASKGEGHLLRRAAGSDGHERLPPVRPISPTQSRLAANDLLPTSTRAACRWEPSAPFFRAACPPAT